jgi:hypothetical protein
MIFKKYFKLYNESAGHIGIKDEFGILVALLVIIAKWCLDIQKKGKEREEAKRCAFYSEDIFNTVDVIWGSEC